MRKNVLVFLIALLTTICAFSKNISEEISQDSTVLITSEQLKIANLIFAEHSKLLKENSLLFEQLNNFKEENRILLEESSVKSMQIEDYKVMSDNYKDNIISLNNVIRNKEKTLLAWKIGGITVSVGLLLFILLK